MTGKLDKWTKEMAPAELGQRLADTLIKLGWDITDSKESKAMLTSTLDMTLKKKRRDLKRTAFSRHTLSAPSGGLKRIHAHPERRWHLPR
ncbi:hypothetical protein HB39_22080 [Vibrio parahaemolyticus]|nr:hypothetical protein HB39_22080 [Vibrio parahaemolyticus]